VVMIAAGTAWLLVKSRQGSLRRDQPPPGGAAPVGDL
jgi:hypothetical protein